MRGFCREIGSFRLKEIVNFFNEGFFEGDFF